MLHRSAPTVASRTQDQPAPRRISLFTRTSLSGPDTHDSRNNEGWIRDVPHDDADESPGRSTGNRSLFAAAPIEDQPERLSPFGCSTFSESTGGGTAAAAAAELASLTGESIAEAVETALQERLKRYRFRNVEIAERLARLAQEVALLGRIDRAPATGQEPPPDEFRASELHCRPVHRTGRQTTDLRA